MTKITKEILTDGTGKEIKKAIDNLKDTVVAANTAKFDEESTLLEVTDARDSFQSLGARLNRKPYYFGTIEDLKKANLKDGDCAITLGYYEPNDGGAGTYNITNLESNSEYQEELNNGLYATLIIENDTINVKQVGAKGDNNNDDTSFITKALNKVTNIFIPNGTYLLSSNINITNKKLNITGDKNSLIKNYGLYFYSCDLNIDSLNFENSLNNSIYNESSTGLIENCKFYDITKVDSDFNLYGGIFCKYPNNITIKNCRFEKCHGYGALYTRGSGIVNIYNNYFDDNDYRALNLTRENQATDYLEGNIFYNYIKDCGKRNTAETGGVACNGMYIPAAIKMKVNFNTIINSRENAIEGFFQECCYNLIDGTNTEIETKYTPSIEAIHINCDTDINTKTICSNNIIKNARKRGIVAIRTSEANNINLIIANNIIEKIIRYEDEETSILTLGNPSMSNKIIANNIVKDEILMQRCDNSCTFIGDIEYLNTSLFNSINMITKNPKITKSVYFTNASDLQGFTNSNSNLSIVNINANKTALKSEYQQYNRIVSPVLTGINKLICVEVEYRGTLRIQLYKNGSYLSEVSNTSGSYTTLKQAFPISDNIDDVYELRFSTTADNYYEISNINYFAY